MTGGGVPSGSWLARIVARLAFCQRCGGVGTVVTSHGLDECPDCHGIGSDKLTKQEVEMLREEVRKEVNGD